MFDLKRKLNKLLRGKVKAGNRTLEFYSHDASLFEIKPQAVIYPRHVEDIKRAVRFVAANKKADPSLSLTGRSAGTDMSGGAINDSIIVDFKNFNHISAVHGQSIVTEPGVYYRKFEKVTLRHGLLMPSYPASRELCMMGGIVSNNAGGEKSLAYGKTENYVTKIGAVWADGQEHITEPLNVAELKHKMARKDFEGQVYREMYQLLEKNYDAIKHAKPRVSKNSTGYNLWDVWNRNTFDLTKLFVGSQGTLGLVTKAEFQLVPVKPLSGMLVAFMPTLNHLGEIINDVLTTRPSSFESFDDHTFKLAMKFMFYFRRTLGWWGVIKLAFSFVPDLFMMLKGLPKLILLVEYEGETQAEIDIKLTDLKQKLMPYNLAMEEAGTAARSRKYWLMRRESFNLLRHKVKNKHTAPFIDDLVVPPPHLPEFLPKLTKILDRYELLYTVAGHMGDGNFHIIPLMDLTKASERAKIPAAMKEVDDLVLHYHGSLSGEHNDGLVRGPFLAEMYGKHIVDLFKKTKQIFDPQNIFNPHKKANSSWSYSSLHIRDHF